MSTNHFGPNTPKAGAWQQYSCTVSGCKGKRRIPVKPALAPMTKPLNCELCGSRQRHRSDGGSSCVEVIDLQSNPSESPAEILGKMKAARRVLTLVPTEDGENRVWLSGDDATCGTCGTLIRPDMYEDGSPFFSILANMKKRLGVAYCPDCHKSGGEQ